MIVIRLRVTIPDIDDDVHNLIVEANPQDLTATTIRIDGSTPLLAGREVRIQDPIEVTINGAHVDTLERGIRIEVIP